MKKLKLRNILYLLLIFLGLLQSFGHIFQSISFKGIGAASVASPLPIVFTRVRGVETFASEFSVDYLTKDSVQHRLEITPEVYSRLSGPYNRRNVYGAAFAYGPLMPFELRHRVYHFGLCSPGTLLKDFGINEKISEATIHIKSKTAGSDDEWSFVVSCMGN